MFTEYASGLPAPLSWAVASTVANKEFLARDGLLRQDFGVYCPMIRRRVRHARQVRDVLRPLFPGYLFVQVPHQRGRLRPVELTTGIRQLIKCGDAPAMIGDTFIRGLKAREVDGAIVKPDQPYQIGQSIRITAGALEGQIATILELNACDRVVVLMQLLSRSVKVQIMAFDIVAA